MTTTIPGKRNHQTAVFVRVHPEDLKNSNAVERINRLNGSLNGNNIKADVFTVRGSTVTAGLELTAAPSAPKPLDAGTKAVLEAAGYKAVPEVAAAVTSFGPRVESPTLRQLAASKGYTLTVIVSAGGDA